MSDNYQSEANAIAAQLINQRKKPMKPTKTFPPIEHVTKPNFTTEEAAYYLNRKPQTLRLWACLKNGPIEPRRVGSALAWNVKEVKGLVGV